MTILSITLFIYSFKDSFNASENRSLRASLFVGLSASGIIPFIHLFCFNDYIQEAVKNPSTINWALGIIMYSLGVVIYVTRFPESSWPGKFCIWVRLKINRK
jgi:adiponectin receptor